MDRNPLSESARPRVYDLGQGITAAGVQPAVPVKPQSGQMSVHISISGGTARTVQAEIAFTAAGPWIPVGTARTTIGDFVETIPAAPLVRLNPSVVTGSTVGAKVYA